MKKLIICLLMLSFVLTACTSYEEALELLKEKESIAQESNVTEEKAEEKEGNVTQEIEALPETEEPKEEALTETEKQDATEVVPEPKTEKQPEVETQPETEKPAVSETPTDSINSLPNDNNGWGFVKKKGAFPEFTKGQMDMMAKYGCIYAGNKAEKVLYLTFDEGYENGYTGAILDTLKEKGVPATFFITGPYLEKNDDLISRMVAEGHIVGNHTVNHPNMPSKGTKEAMQEEILNLDRRFFELYGRHMSYFRPPEGAYSERSLAATNDLGYKTVLWSFAYKDWETDNQKGADYAFESVVPYLHNGCVILLHAVSKDNTEALGRIIDAARAEGYVFKSLDEYVF